MTTSAPPAAMTAGCTGTLVRDRRTGLVDCTDCGLHGRIGDHLPYSVAIAAGHTPDAAYAIAARERRQVNRMLRDGAHTERVVNGPTKRKLAAAAYAALLAAQMDPLFELPVAPPASADPERAPSKPAGGGSRIVRDERLPHPSGQFCASCPNRATLRLTLETGDQVVTCRPCASRYPR
jgi:hypothetical protein